MLIGRTRRLTEKRGWGIHDLKIKKSESTYENILAMAEYEFLGAHPSHDKTCLELNGKEITSFSTEEVTHCTFAEYPKINDTYASRCKLYLVSHMTERETSNHEPTIYYKE